MVTNSTTVSTVILPGDVLNISTVVENLSDVKVYLLLKLSVDVKKSGETNTTNVSTKYYSLSGSNLTQITQTAGASTADISDDNFSSYALTQDAKTTSGVYPITQASVSVLPLLIAYLLVILSTILIQVG